MVTDFEAHLGRLYACRACPNVLGSPITGPVAGARVMLVGQAPGPHEVEDRTPFAWTAGKRLFGWFREHLGVEETTFRERVHIAAVIRCFPGRDPSGGDRVPGPDEIARCGNHLDQEIALLSPRLLIAVGTLASQQLLGLSQLRDVVGVKHRAARGGRTFDVVVLPHPSGRSTWTNKPENRELLQRSLALIAAHPGWRETFSGQKAEGRRQKAEGRSETRSWKPETRNQKLETRNPSRYPEPRRRSKDLKMPQMRQYAER